MTALANRRSCRSFQKKPIPPQILSNLLWAAAGVNSSSGKLTAPSAVNAKTVSILVVTSDGVSRFDAAQHRLIPFRTGNFSDVLGRQAFAKTAPLTLLFVADANRQKFAKSEEDRILYRAADASFISQNVYLFCAANGLGTVVRGAIDRNLLAEKLALPKNEVVVFAQSVGYPVK
ncbi:MAG: nitroreductase family protein [Victivallaceae bacterium]|nr:nitroreductase family protein [Victivallaceae bacterium]